MIQISSQAAAGLETEVFKGETKGTFCTAFCLWQNFVLTFASERRGRRPECIGVRYYRGVYRVRGSGGVQGSVRTGGVQGQL